MCHDWRGNCYQEWPQETDPQKWEACLMHPDNLPIEGGEGKLIIWHIVIPRSLKLPVPGWSIGGEQGAVSPSRWWKCWFQRLWHGLRLLLMVFENVHQANDKLKVMNSQRDEWKIYGCYKGVLFFLIAANLTGLRIKPQFDDKAAEPIKHATLQSQMILNHGCRHWGRYKWG